MVSSYTKVRRSRYSYRVGPNQPQDSTGRTELARLAGLVELTGFSRLAGLAGLSELARLVELSELARLAELSELAYRGIGVSGIRLLEYRDISRLAELSELGELGELEELGELGELEECKEDMYFPKTYLFLTLKSCENQVEHVRWPPGRQMYFLKNQIR